MKYNHLYSLVSWNILLLLKAILLITAIILLMIVNVMKYPFAINEVFLFFDYSKKT